MFAMFADTFMIPQQVTLKMVSNRERPLKTFLKIGFALSAALEKMNSHPLKTNRKSFKSLQETFLQGLIFLSVI
jgi:hypothetical protein